MTTQAETTFEPTVDIGNAVLRAQPFNRQIGARCTEMVRGRATLEIEIGDAHRQQFGTVHGGVLAFAADNVLAFAGGSVLGLNVLTAGFTINFVKPAHGNLLRARGLVVHTNTRQAVCTAQLHMIEVSDPADPADDPAPDEVLCAVAQGTIIATKTTR